MTTAAQLGYRDVIIGHSRGRVPARLHDNGHIEGADCYHAHGLRDASRALRRRFARQVARAISRRRSLGLFKAAAEHVDWTSDPSYRWITIHPHNDPGAKGQPVLLKVHSDGSAHVVGGAGGELTGMRLTKLRSPGEMRIEALRRRDERQAREAREKRANPVEYREKQAQRTAVRAQVADAKQRMLAEVAEAAGWGHAAKLPPEMAAKLKPEQVARLERARVRALERRAKQYVGAIRDEVVQQHNEHIARALGDVPIGYVSPPEAGRAGKGYVDHIAELAAANGLTAPQEAEAAERVERERIAAGVANGYIVDAGAAMRYVQGLKQRGADARSDDAEAVAEGAQRPDVLSAADLVGQDPGASAKVLMAYERYQQVLKQAAELKRRMGGEGFDAEKIAHGVALMSTAEDMPDKDAEKAADAALSQRAMMQATSRLMQSVEDFEAGHGPLEAHVLGARHAQLSALYAAATGEPLPIDRRVSDLLGMDAAASLAAEALRDRLGDRFEEARDKLISRHVRTQMAISSKAVDEADAQITQANALMENLLSLETATPDMLLMIQARNQQRLDMLEEAGRSLGTALGQLEAAGQLDNAMMGRLTGGELRVVMGDTSTRSVVEAIRAFGIKAGGSDGAQIMSDGPNKFLAIPIALAKERLIERTDPQIARDYTDAQAIKAGERDEEGWLPAGIKRRASTEYATDWQPAYQFEAKADFRGKEGETLDEAVRDYAASMLANDGVGSVRDLRNRMLSAEFRADNADPAQAEAYVGAVNALFPVDVIEDPKRAVPLIEELVKRHREAGDKRAGALDVQSVDTSDAVSDVIHRTLSAFPEGKIAFTDGRDRGLDGQAILRSYFWKHLTDEKQPDAAATRVENEETAQRAAEVIGGQLDIFGNMQEVRRGETEGFQAQQADAERGPSAWERYVKACGDTTRAYNNIQDIIKGETITRFAHEYARQYGRALLIGTEPLSHADRHVIGLMTPEEQDKLLAEENARRGQELARVAQRINGRFAPGARLEILEAVKRKQALGQMQLFGARNLATSRPTIGRTAEQQLRCPWSQVALNFDPKRPVNIPTDVRMDGAFMPQQRAVKLVERMGRTGLHLSTGCVAGDTVLTDPVSGVSSTVAELHRMGLSTRVLSLGTDDRFHVARAGVPFVRGTARLLRFVMDDGRAIVVAPTHLFLGVDGWVCADQLAVGDRVCAASDPTGSRGARSVSGTSRRILPTQLRCPSDSGAPGTAREVGQHQPVFEVSLRQSESRADPLASIVGTCQPVQTQDARSSWRTVPGSRSRCWSGSRQCDGQPRPGRGNAQCASPSQGGAQAPSRSPVCADARDSAAAHIRRDQCSGRPSTRGSSLLGYRGLEHSGHTCGTSIRASRVPSRAGQRSRSGSCHSHRVRTDRPVRCDAPAGDPIQVGCLPGSARHAPVPECIREPRRSWGRSAVRAIGAQHRQDPASLLPSWVRIASITECGEAAYYDLTVPTYHNYVAHGVLHHNSGKTLVGIGAFTDLYSQGKAKRALYTVPAKQTGQWGQEALRYVDPKLGLRHFVGAGASAEERRAAYADPKMHMVMVGHDALRDDLTWAVAHVHFGGDEAKARLALSAGSRAVRRADRQITSAAHLYQRVVAREPALFEDNAKPVAERLRYMARQYEQSDNQGNRALAPKLVELATLAERATFERGEDMSGRGFEAAVRRSASVPPSDAAASEQHVRELVQSAATKLGWGFDYTMADEAHDALNRTGKPNSRLANVLDAFTEKSPYYVSATATPVKNDVSEAWDTLHKLRPDRYPLTRKGAFMRKYGSIQDTSAMAEALQREMAPYAYARQVDTGSKRAQHKPVVDMTGPQAARYGQVMDAYRRARRGASRAERMAAVLDMVPPEQLRGMSDEAKRERAERGLRFLGSVRDAALARVVYGNDETLKPEDVGAFRDVLKTAQAHAHGDFDGGQLPGVVFSHSPGAARKLAKYLQANGVRAGVIDGALSSEEADKVRREFFPQGQYDPTDPKGSSTAMRAAAKYDVLVCSDAASHGLNLQRGAWLYHVDPPMTAKTHQQRTGRIDRIGQMHGEVQVYDAHHNAPFDLRRQRILRRKAPLTEMFQAPYELLDQDSSGEAQRIMGEREERLQDGLIPSRIPARARDRAAATMAAGARVAKLSDVQLDDMQAQLNVRAGMEAHRAGRDPGPEWLGGIVAQEQGRRRQAGTGQTSLFG